MIVIVCIDDNGGLMFNNRRQSRDRKLISDMLEMTRGKKLYITEYSHKLFEGADVIVSDDLAADVGADDFCFVENEMANGLSAVSSEIVIYHWNRVYPHDVAFVADLDKMGFYLESVSEFEGYSHEKITKEIFKK